MTEYVLWALPHGSTDRLDEKVLTHTDNPDRILIVREKAMKDGWHSFRVARLDLDIPPNFVSAIAKL